MGSRLGSASKEALRIILEAGEGGITTFDLHARLRASALEFERQRGFLVSGQWVSVTPPPEYPEVPSGGRDEAAWRDQREVLRAGPQLISGGVPNEGIELSYPHDDPRQSRLPVAQTEASRRSSPVPTTLGAAFRGLSPKQREELRAVLKSDRH